MKEAGKIIEIKGEMAVVELARTKACETCRVCLTSSDSYKMIAEARNAINANIGDEIYLELESRNVILASLIVYILPLVLMSVGYLLGSFTGGRILGAENAETAGIIFGFVCLAGSYSAIGAIDKKISKDIQFVPVITSIISDQNTIKAGE